jgi:hypothetical protein
MTPQRSGGMTTNHAAVVVVPSRLTRTVVAPLPAALDSDAGRIAPRAGHVRGEVRRTRRSRGQGHCGARCPQGRGRAGKPVIDATNPIADAPPENGVLKFFTSLDQSLMESLQSAFPDAHFVKAYNSVGNAKMINPQFPGGKATMFICGNDDKAKAIVRGINDQFGWETADMGVAEAARAIDPLCMLWCILGFKQNEWTHAFKLLHKG